MTSIQYRHALPVSENTGLRPGVLRGGITPTLCVVACWPGRTWAPDDPEQACFEAVLVHWMPRAGSEPPQNALTSDRCRGGRPVPSAAPPPPPGSGHHRPGIRCASLRGDLWSSMVSGQQLIGAMVITRLARSMQRMARGRSLAGCGPGRRAGESGWSEHPPQGEV